MFLDDPARGRQLHRLAGRESSQDFFQPIDTFEPPVPKQLGIVGRGDHPEGSRLIVIVLEQSFRQVGEMFRTCIREGTIGPMEITVKLLENAMRAELEKNNDSEAWTDGRGRFLIDGFPRKMDQAIKFEEDVRYVLLSFDYRLYPESRCRCASRLSYYSSRQRRK